MFKSFDDDNKGHFSEDELFKYAKKIGENLSKEEIAEMIKLLTNNVSVINLNDFRRICKTNLQ